MKAYKGFDKDLKCREVQYEVGKEYEEENSALCKKGFHACENPLDTFRYYRPTDSRYCEVDVDDNGERNSTDSKVCGKHIKISAEIGLKGVINAGVRFVFDKCESATEENASGESGNAAASGESGNAAGVIWATPPHPVGLATPPHPVGVATPPHRVIWATPPHPVGGATPPHPVGGARLS